MFVNISFSLNVINLSDSNIIRNTFGIIKVITKTLITPSMTRVWLVHPESYHLFQTLKDNYGNYLINHQPGWDGEIYGVCVRTDKSVPEDTMQLFVDNCLVITLSLLDIKMLNITSSTF